MNKYLMVISLLLVGAAFARSTPDITSGPDWNNYAQACCGYYAASNMVFYGYNNFYLYDGGCNRYNADLLDEINYLGDTMWGDGEYGLYSYYRDYEYYCGSGYEGTPECASAKSTLRSQVSTDKGIFTGGQILAYQKARQALIDNRNEGCGTTRADALSMMQNAIGAYRDCISNQARRCIHPPA